MLKLRMPSPTHPEIDVMIGCKVVYQFNRLGS